MKSNAPLNNVLKKPIDETIKEIAAIIKSGEKLYSDINKRWNQIGIGLNSKIDLIDIKIEGVTVSKGSRSAAPEQKLSQKFLRQEEKDHYSARRFQEWISEATSSLGDIYHHTAYTKLFKLHDPERMRGKIAKPEPINSVEDAIKQLKRLGRLVSQKVEWLYGRKQYLDKFCKFESLLQFEPYFIDLANTILNFLPEQVYRFDPLERIIIKNIADKAENMSVDKELRLSSVEEIKQALIAERNAPHRIDYEIIENGNNLTELNFKNGINRIRDILLELEKEIVDRFAVDYLSLPDYDFDPIPQSSVDYNSKSPAKKAELLKHYAVDVYEWISRLPFKLYIKVNEISSIPVKPKKEDGTIHEYVSENHSLKVKSTIDYAELIIDGEYVTLKPDTKRNEVVMFVHQRALHEENIPVAESTLQSSFGFKSRVADLFKRRGKPNHPTRKLLVIKKGFVTFNPDYL